MTPLLREPVAHAQSVAGEAPSSPATPVPDLARGVRSAGEAGTPSHRRTE